jgi:hypothetical protein
MHDFISSFVIEFVLIVVAGVLCVPFFYLRQRQQATDLARMSETGERTNAVVVEVWNDDLSWNITYEFQPKGKNETVRRTETFESLKTLEPAPAKVGEQIEVAYESRQPYYSVPLLRPTH